MKSLQFTLSSCCMFLMLCCSIAPSVWGQSDVGSIVGFVRDSTDAVVPNAKVEIRNEATQEVHQATTNGDGRYTVTNLQPGLYSLSTEVAGFKKFESVHNRLDANTTLNLSASLAVGQATETIEVTSSASLLQTESGAVQSVIGEQQLQAQELNGRNPIYMASLLPGIRSNNTLGDFNFSLGNGGYTINGTRQQDSLITVDGAPATRTRGNSTSITVANVDSTQEVQVLTGNYAAEYGRTSGGQIRIVTKTGGTDFHGTAFEYFRNSAMDANTWLRNTTASTNFAPPFRYNEFGFSVGGPVAIPHKFERWRQKFFWLVAQDWIRYRFTDTQTQAVPTTLMRQGNFSELLSTANPWYKPVQLVYPGSSTPIPGNVIPRNQLSPNGLAILNAYPQPTPGFLSGTQNWIAQAAHPINQRKGNYNGDFLPADNHRISFRRTDFAYDEYQPFDQGSGLTGKYFHRPNQANSLAWTWTISPTMINEARITLSIDDVYIPVNTALSGFNATTLGINFPYIFPTGKDIASKIPTINVPTFYGLAGGPYPSHSSGPIYTASDSLTKVSGNHTLKFGFYVERSGENDEDQINVNTVPGGANNQNGSFQFTDDLSGVGLANLAFGRADTYTEIGPRAYTIWRSNVYEWFAQDSWKVTDQLHLDFGLRDTITQPFSPQWGNSDYFDPALYNSAQAVRLDPKGNVIVGSGNQYNGVVIPGFSSFPSSATGRVPAASSSAYNGLFAPGLSKGYVNTTDALQPRFGLAYQVDPKMVIRLGIGRFVTRMGLLDNIFPGGNSPFQPFVTVTNVSVDNPGAALNSSIAAPLTLTTLNKNLKSPETWTWNATIQRSMGWNSVLSVGYVANHGLHEWQVFDLNQPTLATVQANPGMSFNALRPYKGFAAIQEERSNVNSAYQSLQISWDKRVSKGLTVNFAYTLGYAQDGGSNYRDIVPNTYYTRNLWGPSEYDNRHTLTVSYSYDLPFFKSQNSLPGKLLGGWQINGTIQAQTGTPCGVGTNNDYAFGASQFGSFGCGSEGQFWTLNTGGVQTLGGFGSQKYIATTTSNGSPVFSAPAAGTFNNQVGIRDEVYGPGWQNWNLGLFKKFPISERAGLEFRAEAYNFINHANWAYFGQANGTTGELNFTPTSSTFGEVTAKSSANPRQLQLSLRFAF